ncbi:hypothetical protein [Novosphingobium gossypii]
MRKGDCMVPETPSILVSRILPPIGSDRMTNSGFRGGLYGQAVSGL